MSLKKSEFPRAGRYDEGWVLRNQMGPNALWLAEWLAGAMGLKRGMRVLDLGCGKAMTSVFLAREFGVRVWAADLWVDPTENWARAEAAGARGRVCPLRAEAHALPFADGFFDAAVSVDAYQYFGTDELYLPYLSRFVRAGGPIGVAVPCLMRDFPGGRVPRHLSEPQPNGKAFWVPECYCFKTARWWRALWERSDRVDVRVADTLPDGWKHWRDFERAVEASGFAAFPSYEEALKADRGRYIGFARLVAASKGPEGLNLYEPGLLARLKRG